MKTFPNLVLISFLILWGSGCQHVNAPSLTSQDKFFKSLRVSNPGEERALRCAQYHNLIGRHDLALQELSKAVASDSHNVRLLNAMGNCYDKLGRYSQAQEIYEKILVKNAEDFPAKNNLGYSCYLSGDLGRAEKIFQEILSKNPENTVARNNLGLVWCRQGKESRALSLWQKNDGEITAKEKLHQVLAYLGKSGNQAGNQTIKNTDLQSPVVAQGRTNQSERNKIKDVLASAENKSVDNKLINAIGSEKSPRNNQKSASLVGKLSQEPRVKVEEVKMIVQPATYTQTTSEEKVAGERVPVPPLPQEQNDKLPLHSNPLFKAKNLIITEHLLQEEIPSRQHYYRRPRQCQRYKKPKIINCQFEAVKESHPIKKCLVNESVYQNPKASGRQVTIF